MAFFTSTNTRVQNRGGVHPKYWKKKPSRPNTAEKTCQAKYCTVFASPKNFPFKIPNHPGAFFPFREHEIPCHCAPKRKPRRKREEKTQSRPRAALYLRFSSATLSRALHCLFLGKAYPTNQEFQRSRTGDRIAYTLHPLGGHFHTRLPSQKPSEKSEPSSEFGVFPDRTSFFECWLGFSSSCAFVCAVRTLYRSWVCIVFVTSGRGSDFQASLRRSNRSMRRGGFEKFYTERLSF